MVNSKGTPLDAPLYEMDPLRGIEYWGCKAVMATFTVGGDVAELVPRGLHLEDPAIGAVLVADYGASTLGPYGEFVSFLRVTTDDGVAGMYIPYIYVTNDAALTAGREVLGAPKKLAAITVDVTSQAVVGSLARPVAHTLAEVIVAPAGRLDSALSDALLPPGTPFFSRRHLPGPPGATQVHELIRWNCDLAVRADAFGDPLRFTGPASINYPTHSGVDPVHRLAVETFLGGVYMEFDMRLTAGGVVWSETVAADSVRSDAVGASA
jgi:acetoacetate decarboxylase